MLRLFFITAGLVSLAFGFLGIFTPLLPTTPFLLLSAYCFSRGSTRLHRWLVTHRLFGPLIRDWEHGRVIRPRVKWTATVMLVGMVSYPLLFRSFHLGLKTLVMVVVASVLIFIWSCPGDHGTGRST